MNNDAILLTGATGFLGGYLLRELLRNTDSPVYCLSRSRQGIPARERVLDNARFLFGEQAVLAWPQERLEMIEGDVGEDNLGLPPYEYARLTAVVGSVFHSAAMLWHFGKKEEFENVNVLAVRRLLDFAQTGRPKALNHISTLAVSGRRCDNPDNRFTENDFHKDMECPNVYVESKHNAERILMPALKRGENVRIFRPGFLMGDSGSGRFKKHITSDAQYLHLQGHILMRTAPPLHADDYMDLTPVDYAAAAIAAIALQADAGGAVYHICNPQPILKSDIWHFIKNYGYPIRVVPPENYMTEALGANDDLFMQGLQSVLVYLGDYEKSPAVFDASRSQGRLEGTGISCPAPEQGLLKRYLDYCVSIGFIPTPEEIRRYERDL